MKFIIEEKDLELTPIEKLWKNLKKLTLEEVRNDIPMVNKGIYLDSSATSLTPTPVLEEMLKYYMNFNVNIERGGYSIAEYATDVWHYSHSETARILLGCSERELISTRNTTEAINMIVSYFMNQEKLEGKNIILSDIEHHSNMLPWIRLAKRKGMEVKIIDTDNMPITSSKLEELIDENTILVAIQHISNITGIRQDVHMLSKICKEKNVLIAIDGAQSVGHEQVNVKEIGCDFYAFSGHKGPMGPTGTGGLYVSEELLEDNVSTSNSQLLDNGSLGIRKFTMSFDYVNVKYEPMLVGGGTIVDVNYDNYTLTESPSRYHAGTPNIAGEIGLARAAKYVGEQIGFENIRDREKMLVNKLIKGLSAINNVEIYGPNNVDYKTGLVAFNIKGQTSYEVAKRLDDFKIYVRSGVHCVMPWHKKHCLMDSIGTVRASVHFYNTENEIEKFLEVVEMISSLKSK